MKNEMYCVANVSVFYDDDYYGANLGNVNIEFAPKGKAIETAGKSLWKMGDMYVVGKDVDEEHGNYVAIFPAEESSSVNIQDVCKLYAHDLEKVIEDNDVLYEAWQEVYEMEEELEKMEKETAEEELTDTLIAGSEVEFPAKETSRRRKHIKGDNKAKRHLATIYPISTDSVRRTRNGAYIHKGNTCKWDWKRYDNKLSRLEGKRICREWEPEEPETTMPEEPDILTRIADLEEELHWNMAELAAAQEEVDYYLAECLAISNEIERLRKLL